MIEMRKHTDKEVPKGVFLYLNKSLRVKVQEDMESRGYASPSTTILAVLKEHYGVS